MTLFCNGKNKLYELMMQQRPNIKKKEFEYCHKCPNFRPDWKYRFCKYAECPFLDGYMTFKDNG